MNAIIYRLPTREGFTLGAFVLEGTVRAFTLEDQPRAVKVPGSTRIPAGQYRLALRTVGRLHERYRAKFGAEHRGMIEILNVPGFTAVLIHIGNTAADSAGCVLVGEQASVEGIVQSSERAYRNIYAALVGAVAAGTATLTIKDPN